MEPQKAINLIRQFDIASTAYTIANNKNVAKGTISRLKRKFGKARQELFRALVGSPPSPDHEKEMDI